MPVKTNYVPVSPSESMEMLSLAIYTGAAVLLIAFLLIAAWWLGGKKQTDNKEIAYESGIIPTGTARLAYPVPFYLVAIFFIVFDVEAVFIFTWAVAWDQLGLARGLPVSIFGPVSEVWRCDLMERPRQQLELAESSLSGYTSADVALAPHAVETLWVRFAGERGDA